MAHPFASQAKSSQKARLKRLGGKAGKSWGSSSMYKAKSLPGKNAGSSTPMTISGGSSKSRPDRMAAGGSVGKKRHPHATTNIIISHAGGRGGSGGGGGAGPTPQPVPVPRPVPVPVNRPVPVPVGGAPGPGGPPPGAGMAGPGMVPPRPPMPPAGPPPGAGPPMRPPGMAAGGAVKKAAKGGFLKETNSPKAGDAYPGFPHSPTTKAKSTVSAKADGGGVKKRAGGGGITLTKKLQFGGGSGADTGLGMGVGAGPGMGGGGPGQAGPAGAANAALGAGPGRVPLPPQQGAPNISGREAIPFSQPNTVPLSGFGARNFSTRPAPGTTTSYAKKGGAIYKKGGAVHDDEAEDKKLFKKMIKQEDKAEKKASGGGVGPGLVGHKYRTNSPKGGKGKGMSPYSDAHEYHQQGKGYADGGNVHGAGSAAGRMARNNKVPAKTEL